MKHRITHNHAPARRLTSWLTQSKRRMVWNSFCPTGEGGGVDSSCSSGEGGSVPLTVKAEANFVSKFPGVSDHFQVHIVGSWAKQDPSKAPDRKGKDTSDFDVILTPKPSSAKGLAKFKERDERSELIETIKREWKFARPLQIHEGEVASTSKSIRITINARHKVKKTTRRPNPFRFDPTRTGTLRRAFATSIRKRFMLLKGKLVKFVGDSDEFGLGKLTMNEQVSNGDPNQPRDEKGQWVSEGGVGGYSLTEEEKGKVFKYTLGHKDVHDIHMALRLSMGEKAVSLKELATDTFFKPDRLDYVTKIDSAIDKHKLEESKSLLRGVTKDVLKDIKRLKPGEVLWDKSYKSVTTSKEVAKQFSENGGAVLQINIPKGARALPVSRAGTAHSGQEEYILPRDSELVYKGKVGNKHTFDVIDPRSMTMNSFCPTGEGGGVDPSCSPTGLISVKEIGKGTSSEKVDTVLSEKFAAKYKCLENQCYSNAGKVVQGEKGYTYVEGVFVTEDGSERAAHAWAVDKSGKIVDPTFHEHGVYYPLVKFSKEEMSHYGKQTAAGNRIIDKMHKKGVDTREDQLDELLDKKSSKDFEKEAAIGKGSKAKGGFDYRTLKAPKHEHDFDEEPSYTPPPRPSPGKAVKIPVPEKKGASLVSYVGKTKFLFKKEGSHYQVLIDGKGHGIYGADLESARKQAERLVKLKGITVNSYFPIDPPMTNADYKLQPSAEKVKSFQKWLEEQYKDTLTGASEDALWARYVQEGYKKGAGRAFDDVKQPGKYGGVKEKLDWYKGTKDQFLKSAFGRPESIEKVKLLAGRSFDDLEGVTKDMSTKMSRILTDGLVKGMNPRDVAKEMAKQVDLGESRAETIARTEIIRAHAEGQLDAMEQLGVEEVGVAVEWSTAGDDRVCEQCIPLEGIVMKLDEARGMLPRHPNCVVGDTQICAPGLVHVMMAEYTGEVFDFTMSDGRVLTTTAHHILLTQRGWVFAKDISYSDYLVNTPYEVLAKSPYKDLREPLVSDVFQSFVEVSEKERITETIPSSEDLHGDGKSVQSKIHIIRTYRELWNKLKTLKGSYFVESLLGERHIPSTQSQAVYGESTLSTFFKGAGATADSLVRSLGVTEILLARSLLHHNPVSVSLRADMTSAQRDYSADSPRLDSHPVVDPQSTDSLRVQLDNLLNGKLTEIKFLSSRHVSNLQVYDVGTETTLYSVNGLVSSNCRCAWLPANVGESKEDQLRGKGLIDKAIISSRGEKKEGAEGWGFGKKIDTDRPKGIITPTKNVDHLDALLISINSFCPTGPGGGVDPTCSPGEGGGSGGLKLPSFDKLETVKALGGSNGAVVAKDENGKEWVLKNNPSKQDQLKNEVDADAAYRALGVSTPKSGLIEGHDGVAKVSEFMKGGQNLAEWKQGKDPVLVEAMHKQIGKNFVADALLANWDVAGLANDNILVDKTGLAHRIDNGGALLYRAQGAPKGSKFGGEVTELSTLRNSSLNPTSAKIFEHLTNEDIHAQIKEILPKKDAVLAAIKDEKTKGIMEKRFQYLADQLPTNTSSKPSSGEKIPPNPYLKPSPKWAGLSTANELEDHVKSNMGDVKFTQLHLDKIKYLNPDGIKNNTFITPQTANPASDKAQLEQLKKILPPGTIINKVDVKGKDLAEAMKSGKIANIEFKATHVLKHLKDTEGVSQSITQDKPSKTYKAPTGPGSWSSIPDKYLPEPSGGKGKLPRGPEYDKNANNKWAADLNSKESSVISSWKSNSGSIRKAFVQDPNSSQSKALISALNKAKPHEGVVYRGIHGEFADKLAAELEKQIGGHWSEDCPTGFSMNSKTAASFSQGDLLLRVTTKNAKPICKAHNFDSEEEVLGMPNTKYRILKVHKDVSVSHVNSKGSSDSKHIKYLVDLEEV